MRKNPLTILGRLDQCFLFMYRCPVDLLRPYIPECFKLISYQGYAIIGIVVSHLTGMRPWPLPQWTGMSYSHVGYRAYVEFTPPQGSPIRGIYFLRSDANHSLMKAAGNLLTNYRFHYSDITIKRTPSHFTLEITNSAEGKGDAQATLLLNELTEMPPHSMFTSVEEAKRTLRYEPYGLSYDHKRNVVNIVKVTRDETKWREISVIQENAHFCYLDTLFRGHGGLEHELTICVESINYRWERGVEYRL